MQADWPADVDRLPWLEPYREAKAPVRRARGGLIALIAALLLLPVAVVAGFYLGQRAAEPVQPPPSTIVPLPKPRPAPVLPSEPPVVEALVTPPEAVPQPPPPRSVVEPAPPARTPAVKRAKPARKAVKRRSVPRATTASAGSQRSSHNAVRARQEQVARARPWPKMPSPGPAGQVVQLGAFSTSSRAYSAYSARIDRYPMLARMPRVIMPVISKPDGRVLYVLRLGTTSRQQSKSVCRRLKRSGNHCLVIG